MMLVQYPGIAYGMAVFPSHMPPNGHSTQSYGALALGAQKPAQRSRSAQVEARYEPMRRRQLGLWQVRKCSSLEFGRSRQMVLAARFHTFEALACALGIPQSIADVSPAVGGAKFAETLSGRVLINIAKICTNATCPHPLRPMHLCVSVYRARESTAWTASDRAVTALEEPCKEGDRGKSALPPRRMAHD